MALNRVYILRSRQGVFRTRLVTAAIDRPLKYDTEVNRILSRIFGKYDLDRYYHDKYYELEKEQHYRYDAMVRNPVRSGAFYKEILCEKMVVPIRCLRGGVFGI